MKFKLRIYCDDGDGHRYWEDGVGEYETYDKALVACYRNALGEAQELMVDTGGDRWFEVEQDFEITEAYVNNELADVVMFPVAVCFYDHAPHDRENDCDICIVTGYSIVDAEADDEIRRYNSLLRETHGRDITVEIKSYIEDDGTTRFYYTTARYGDSDDTWDTAKEAYEEANCYLNGVGELW